MAARAGSSQGKRSHGHGHGRGGGGRGAASHVQARLQNRETNGQAGPKSIHDVFEYATEQQEGTGKGKAKGGQRRLQRASANTIDESEARWNNASFRRGEEEQDEQNGSSTRRNHDFGTAPILGGNGSDGEVNVIASEDDEEIESDEAFDESDEERYADWKFASDKKKRAGRSTDQRKVNFDEGEEEDEDVDGEEDEDDDDDDADMVDLSKLLDESDFGSQSDEEEGDDEHDIDEDKLQRHMEAISGASTKRNADQAALPSSTTAGKRRVLQDRTEAVPEGEWNAPARQSGSGLTIDDLIKPISEQAGTSLTSLRNKTKALRSSTDGEGKQAVASMKGGGTLSAPLPSIIQDRLDRSAAYEETKAEVEGWQSTIKRLREAEHLSFPLQPEPVMRPSTSALAAHFKPSNVFEHDVAALLEREGATEKQLAQAEELKMNEQGMSAEEIRHRTAELRRMRELLFREEQKAKRVSKIKSKTYRRIARKQKQREQEKAREGGLLDGGGEDEDDEEARMKAERLRAKERATLKHKNAGKWAKSVLSVRGMQDMPEARQAIEEQLLRGEQLRRRIHGEGSENDSYGSEEGEDGISDAGSDDIRRAGFNEMQSFGREAGEQDRGDEEEMASRKGIWGMEFMRQARERQARDTRVQVDSFNDEMDRDDEQDDESDDDIENHGALGQSMQIGANPGRMVFDSTDTASKPRQIVNEGHAMSDLEPTQPSQTDAQARILRIQDVRPHKGQASAPQERRSSGQDDVNPWLSASTSSKVSRKRNTAVVSKEGSAQSKAAHRVERHAAKADEARKEDQDDAQLVIDPTAQMQLRDAMQAHDGRERKQSIRVRTSQTSRSKGNPVEPDDESGSSDSDEEGSVQNEPAQVSRHAPTAMQQRNLVAEAFSGDDVLADFAAEKKAIVEADAPQEVDTFLPGWGAWAGKGVRSSKKQAEERKKRFTKLTAGLAPEKRKDADLTKVIINQKQDKKADRYKSKDVPYPYTSRAQYEMAMRNPLGPEWNTRTQHQRLTLPRVVTKPGKAIKPIGTCIPAPRFFLFRASSADRFFLFASVQRSSFDILPTPNPSILPPPMLYFYHRFPFPLAASSHHRDRIALGRPRKSM